MATLLASVAVRYLSHPVFAIPVNRCRLLAYLHCRAIHAPAYAPKTVTTDGWDATRWAWEHLFPGIVWILCFLHEVIKVRDWCRSKPDLRYGLAEDLWHIYHAQSKRQFAQRLRRFLEWVDIRALPGAIKQRLLRLRAKSTFFQRAYDFPDAYRTSNQVDRPMNQLDRTLFAMQGCHCD